MPYYKLLYHAVWSTKGRNPWISEPVETAISSAIQSTCDEFEIPLHGFGCASDHVHVVFGGKPTIDLSKLIGRMKGGASHAVNAMGILEHPFQWQREYGIITITERALPSFGRADVEAEHATVCDVRECLLSAQRVALDGDHAPATRDQRANHAGAQRAASPSDHDFGFFHAQNTTPRESRATKSNGYK